tara:strand:- start:562 stop:765 length:204 start_codon:yes stop_codon:yes gene_type:complete
MTEAKLSKEELEGMLKNLFDTTSYMKAGGAFTSYGFLLSDYIRAHTNLSTLQEVLTERYGKEDKFVH